MLDATVVLDLPEVFDTHPCLEEPVDVRTRDRLPELVDREPGSNAFDHKPRTAWEDMTPAEASLQIRVYWRLDPPAILEEDVPTLTVIREPDRNRNRSLRR